MKKTVAVLLLLLSLAPIAWADENWGSNYPVKKWMKLSQSERQIYVKGAMDAFDYMVKLSGKRLVAKDGKGHMTSPQSVEALVWAKLVESDILREGPIVPVIIVVMSRVLDTYSGGRRGEK